MCSPLKITVMSELYAVRKGNTRRIPHGATSNPWYIEPESTWMTVKS